MKRSRYYSVSVWQRSNVMIVPMCLSCPHAYLQNHVTDLRQIFVHVASDRGSVIFWRHCNTLCTFGWGRHVIFMCQKSCHLSCWATSHRTFSDSGLCNALQHWGGESDAYDFLVVIELGVMSGRRMSGLTDGWMDTVPYHIPHSWHRAVVK